MLKGGVARAKERQTEREEDMSKAIVKPRIIRAAAARQVEAGVEELVELTAEPASRSEIEVWNASFPRRAWTDRSGIETLLRPRVRPAGHERPKRK